MIRLHFKATNREWSIPIGSYRFHLTCKWICRSFAWLANWLTDCLVRSHSICVLHTDTARIVYIALHPRVFSFIVNYALDSSFYFNANDEIQMSPHIVHWINDHDGMRCGVNCLLTEHVKLNIYDKHQFNGLSDWVRENRRQFCVWLRPTDITSIFSLSFSILFMHRYFHFEFISRHFSKLNQMQTRSNYLTGRNAHVVVVLIYYRAHEKCLNDNLDTSMHIWKYRMRKSLVALFK